MSRRAGTAATVAPATTTPATAAALPDAASPSAAHRHRQALPWILLALSLVGFLVALYLTLSHYRGTILNCYVVHGCDEVQSSRYATVLGIPIALFGTLYFVVFFYATVAIMTLRSRRVVIAYKALAFVGALAAVPLFMLQAAILKAFCSYCIVVEIVLVLTWIASLALRGAPRPADAGENPIVKPLGQNKPAKTAPSRHRRR